MRFQFIHTADLHIDSPLRGLSRYEGAPVESVRSAAREAFTALIDAAIGQRVGFIVISGDIVDGRWNDTNAGLFFIQQCRRATELGIRVFVIWGNHDAESEVMRRLTMPEGVHVFGHRKPGRKLIPELRVAVTGQSYGKRDVYENLAASYPGPEAGYFNIAMLHTALTGSDKNHLPYAPCTPGELAAKGMDYWALGHVHTPEIVSRTPWIVFPGNLQGRSVRETGPRGALLVTVDNGRVSSVDPLRVETMRWELADIDVSGVEAIEDVANAARAAFGPIEQAADGLPLAIRVTLSGRTPLHAFLQRNKEELRVQIVAVAAGTGSGKLWIERIRDQTKPTRSREAIAARGDAVAEFQALLDKSVEDEDLHRELAQALSGIVAKLPEEVIADVDDLVRIREGKWGEIVQRLSPELIDALVAEG